MFAVAQEHVRNAVEVVTYAMLIQHRGPGSGKVARPRASCALEPAYVSNATVPERWMTSSSVINRS